MPFERRSRVFKERQGCFGHGKYCFGIRQFVRGRNLLRLGYKSFSSSRTCRSKSSGEPVLWMVAVKCG